MHLHSRLLVLGAAVCLTSSCGGTDDKSGDSAGTSTDGTFGASEGSVDGECPEAVRVGRFVVDQTVDYAFADGQVSDAVVPRVAHMRVLGLPMLRTQSDTWRWTTA